MKHNSNPNQNNEQVTTSSVFHNCMCTCTAMAIFFPTCYLHKLYII